MALLDLYFELQNKRLVFSESNPRTFVLPDLYREDRFTINFRALKRVRSTSAPFFERVSLTSFALTIAIGTADTPLASASSWTASDNDTLLTGTLDLQTAGINALADGASSIFEIKLSIGGEPYRGQFPVTIRKSVSTSGALNPVVNDTALGVLEADRTYLRKEMRAGEGILWQSADALQLAIEYLHNDGSHRFEAVT